MAERLIFMPAANAVCPVDEMSVDFVWHAGFSAVQKKKNVAALHASARKKGLSPLLEISTKSDEELGRRLSAFSLKVTTPAGKAPLESAYQGSKVFAGGGPYTDLFQKSARDAKTDSRLRNSGALIKFKYDGHDWQLTPKTAFYDWLYISTLQPHQTTLKRLYKYKGFTDIEFNANKMVNCQARSCALMISLMKLNLLDEWLRSPQIFIDKLQEAETARQNYEQIAQENFLMRSSR